MDGLIFCLLFLALAIGFGMGRLSHGLRRRHRGAAVHPRYLEGLRQLIEEQHDAALDTLIGALDVNETTIETHFSLGALWRRKGEVDRAIRIHQNIIERAGLPLRQLHQAQLELALDYTRAGLLDRAEALLQELKSSSVPEIRRPALQELVYLCQEEREWEKAIQHAESLCQKAGPGELEFWRHLQAHYCCEQVESDLTETNSPSDQRPPQAGEIAQKLSLARKYFPAHNRALLLQARQEFEQGDLAGAFATIAHLRIEEPYLMVVLPVLTLMYQCADRPQDLLSLLEAIYGEHQTAPLIPVLASLIHQLHGSAAACAFAEAELRGREPEFLAELLGLLDPGESSYAHLASILERALPFRFHCEACGFEGRQFYWCCPTCKHWL